MSTNKTTRKAVRAVLVFLVLSVIVIFQFPLIISLSNEYMFVENNIHTFTADDTDMEARPEKKKMNIVFLYADDWRFDSLGSLNPIVKTPFLDKLAQQGMLFTQNAVTTSICWVSRACLATGQHYARHKQQKLAEPIAYYKYWKDTLYGKLRDNGYFTGVIGKWQPGTMHNSMFNFSKIYSGFHFQGDQHIIDMNAQDSLHFLQNERKNVNDPFALFVNFFAPHHIDGNPEQYFPQRETTQLYQNVTVPFAPTCTDEAWKNLPPFFNEINEARKRWRYRFNEPRKAQKMIKNYFRLISGVDAACGKIFAELDRQNLTENTLIIFTTDNGYYHAEHGLADKFYAHQESIRVPLIIKDPRMNKDLIGEKNDDFTLSIDLAPTMLEAAGISTPERMQGTDMSQLYKGKNASAKADWREKFYYEFPGHWQVEIPPVQALVRKNYKYIYWPNHNYEELFHLPSDPYEEHNLVLDEKNAQMLSEFRAEFKIIQKEAA